MISCITLFRKKPEMSAEEFRTQLEESYAPKCLAVGGLAGYEQNYVYLKEKGDASHDALIADAFSIERYETLREYELAHASAEYKEATVSHESFADYTESFTCLENVSIPCRITPECKKKISLLQRTAPSVSFVDYTREWFVVHSGCMMRMPKDVFYGYNQHLVIDRKVNGEPASYEQLSIDGILELFYSEASEVANAFKTTEEGQTVVSHRKEFMCGVDPFQVDFTVFK